MGIDRGRDNRVARDLGPSAGSTRSNARRDGFCGNPLDAPVPRHRRVRPHVDDRQHGDARRARRRQGGGQSPATNRNSTGIIQNWSGIDTLVTNQIANVTTVPFTVAHAQPIDGGIPLVEVTVTSGQPVLYMFAPLWAGAPEFGNHAYGAIPGRRAVTAKEEKDHAEA